MTDDEIIDGIAWKLANDKRFRQIYINALGAVTPEKRQSIERELADIAQDADMSE